jgi:hypothetical protein
MKNEVKTEKELTSYRQLGHCYYERRFTLRSSAPLEREEIRRKTSEGQEWKFVGAEFNGGEELPYSYNVISRYDSGD